MKYAAIAMALSISALGILLDDITTFIGLSRGFVETNPIYPYSLLVIPVFYILFLVGLEHVRLRVIPHQYKQYFIFFMLFVALISFKGFVNNTFVLLAPNY